MTVVSEEQSTITTSISTTSTSSSTSHTVQTISTKSDSNPSIHSLSIRTPRRHHHHHRYRHSRRLATRNRNVSPFRQLIFDEQPNTNITTSTSTSITQQQQEEEQNVPSNDLQLLLNDIRQQAAQKFRKNWGFDILTGEPLQNTSWKWTPIS